MDSALAHPLKLSFYQQPNVAALAAAYGVGLAKNHAFVDGNKRAVFFGRGLVSCRQRLRIAGHPT
ncbi:Fic family protein [Rhodoferax sp.]|uniref:Fic family protein n=1 Tax=Rhodoferax sp. TaxID=50421 RepID=UPI002ABAF0E0|nr:Fic family protein [Rhodoferax sp.]MDZ4208192.1 Fic family protein [Rhodoferax sp.]